MQKWTNKEVNIESKIRGYRISGFSLGWRTSENYSEISEMAPTKSAKEIATLWRTTAACTLPRHENEFPLTGFSAINQLNRPPVQGVANEASASEQDVLMIGSFDDDGVWVSHRLLPSVRRRSRRIRANASSFITSPRPFLTLYIKINHGTPASVSFINRDPVFVTAQEFQQLLAQPYCLSI